jgi:hypothetical protein
MTNTTAATPLTPPVVPEDVGCTLIMGGHTWGKGVNLIAAKAAFRSYGGRLHDGYLVLKFDDVTEFMGVDQMGRVSWRSIDGSPAQDHRPTEREVPAK